MTKIAVVLAPVNEITRKRTVEYNSIAAELGGNIKFVLVDSDLPLDKIAQLSEGGIAITTPVGTSRSASSGIRWKLIAEKAKP